MQRNQCGEWANEALLQADWSRVQHACEQMTPLWTDQ